MAIFKCKLCGGALEIDGSQSVATCEFCGTKQTLPRLDDEKKANLYDRATHFRRNNDFDKAMSIYELILNEDRTDAESYWSILLCRYGIEYVEDPQTKRRIPTVNRAQYTSIFDDEDYKAAIAHADNEQRELYEQEARQINEIQKGYLAISQREEPFDVFICYKDTDANGRRTQDSVLAMELYSALTKEGFKVFFSRVTLESKLGIAYEPYIFAALNTAKVMIALGTRQEHFNAVWVKNEWSRYLALIKNGAEKTLIPAYRDMDPYDLPEEFSHLQAQDMGKIGFLQDLVHGVKKLVEVKDTEKSIEKTVIVNSGAGVEPLFKRADMALEDREFEKADAFCEQILNQEPENALAYVYKLLAALGLKSRSELGQCEFLITENSNFKKAMRFADAELKNELVGYARTIESRLDQKRQASIYQRAVAILNSATYPDMFLEARALFEMIPDYENSAEMACLCTSRAQEKARELEQRAKEIQRQKEIKAKERAALRRKIVKRSVIALAILLVVGLISFAVYFSVAYVIVPDSLYDEAMELVDEKDYKNALAKLKEAYESAYFDEDVENISAAITTVDGLIKLEEAQKEADRLAKEEQDYIDGVAGNAAAALPSGEYEKIISTLLKSGVDVTINYDAKGGVCEQGRCVKLTDIDSFTSVSTATKEGYSLNGWEYTSHSYDGEERMFTMGLSAQWKPVTYKIKYALDGGTVSSAQSYTIESDDFVLGIPKRTGYEFTGWTSNEISEPTMYVTVQKGSVGDRIYFSNWKACTYTVTFMGNGAKESFEEAEATYGKPLALPSASRDGYTFLGWYTPEGERETGASWSYDSGKILIAKWGIIEYSVEYNLGQVSMAENPNATSFNVEGAVALSHLTYEGCTFEGWFLDPELTQGITEIPKGTCKNMTVYAGWTVHTYRVSYDMNGGAKGENEKDYTVEYTVLDLPLYLPRPTKENCYFYYWSLNDRNGEIVNRVDACGDYALFANYCTAGVTTQYLSSIDGRYNYASYKGSHEIVEIPKYTKDGKLIDGLYDITGNNLKALVLTNGIEIVKGIWNCPLLEEVVFEEGLKRIVNYSFSNGSTKPKRFVMPSSLTFCDFNFGSVEDIECTVYKNGKYLGNENNPYVLFIGSVSAHELAVELHPDTRVIANRAFENNKKLYSLVIPSGVQGVHSYAFYGCSNLLEIYNLSDVDMSNFSVKIHNSLDEPSIALADENGFLFRLYSSTGMYKLMGYLENDRALTLPNSINGNSYGIGDYAFYGTDITCVYIPSGVVSIGEKAFGECMSLLKITVASTVSSVDTSAFYGSNITEVYNLSTVDISTYDGIKNARCYHTKEEESCITLVGDFLFHCNKEGTEYTLVYYQGSDVTVTLPSDVNGSSYKIGRCAFYGNATVEELILSQGVTEICGSAFEGATLLKRVTISASVKKIGAMIFSGCKSIQAVYFEDPNGWAAVNTSGNESISAQSLSNEETARNYLYDRIYYYLPWIKE